MHPSRFPLSVLPATLASGVLVTGACGGSEGDADLDRDPGEAEEAGRCASAIASKPFRYRRALKPPATVVVDEKGRWVATFTDGSYTVRTRGPKRVLSEPTAGSPIATMHWVRVLPQPFSGTVHLAWLYAALADPGDDVIGRAMQYIEGAPPLVSDGLKVAGDASYGPLLGDGTHAEGSDFNDYLGVTWTYGGGTVDPPEPDQQGSLDCSGFMRMVWGYRSGLPMAAGPSADGKAVPRRAVQMAASAPGVVLIEDAGKQVTDMSPLRPGDLVFFDVSSDDGTAIDHVGLFLGIDDAGRYRFVSSRKKANGPTMGDYGGVSLLDGTGFYAKGFRAARRL